MAKKKKTEKNNDVPAVIGDNEYKVMTLEVSKLQEVMSANIGIGTVRAWDLPRIQLPTQGGDEWRLPTPFGVESEESFEAIIVHWRDARLYWKIAFEESGGGTPPDCKSNDGLTGIGEPGGVCAQCPYAQFGSADRGDGQACKQLRMLFLVMTGDSVPKYLPLPPTSLSPMRQYFMQLLSADYPFYAVTTRFSLRQAGDRAMRYSVVDPQAITPLGDDQLLKISAYRKAIQPFLDEVEVQGDDYASTTEE